LKDIFYPLPAEKMYNVTSPCHYFGCFFT